MTVTIPDLFASPDHYLFAFDGTRASFARMDRAAYARSIFLDRRIVRANDTTLVAPVDALVAHHARHPTPAPQIGWIFHIAHCGSTLLARAIDHTAKTLVLREPAPLRQLGVAAARIAGDSPSDDWRARLSLTLAMLDRRYVFDAPVIVKANVPVNWIIPDLMAANPDAPALFLHFTLDDYLAAILRSPNHRGWVTTITGELRAGIESQVGPITGLAPPELAAALWLAQMLIYADMLNRYPNARSLDAELLFDSPGPAVVATAALFGHAMSDDARDALLADPLFATYSKNPHVAFDNVARHARRAEVLATIAPEIVIARGWVRSRLAAVPIPDCLPRPLVGANPYLLAV